jgi:ketosteroid isomerase-like protein
MSSPQEKVADYYPAIDRVDHDAVLSLFAPDAVYKRADVEYRNLTEIRAFFCEKRQIRGRHTIDRIWADRDGTTVFVTGAFDGQGGAGDPRSVQFADVWQFNDVGLVRERQTYLAMGHAYVER